MIDWVAWLNEENLLWLKMHGFVLSIYSMLYMFDCIKWKWVIYRWTIRILIEHGSNISGHRVNSNCIRANVMNTSYYIFLIWNSINVRSTLIRTIHNKVHFIRISSRLNRRREHSTDSIDIELLTRINISIKWLLHSITNASFHRTTKFECLAKISGVNNIYTPSNQRNTTDEIMWTKWMAFWVSHKAWMSIIYS